MQKSQGRLSAFTRLVPLTSVVRRQTSQKSGIDARHGKEFSILRLTSERLLYRGPPATKATGTEAICYGIQ